jgi:hypothetical protein
LVAFPSHLASLAAPALYTPLRLTCLDVFVYSRCAGTQLSCSDQNVLYMSQNKAGWWARVTWFNVVLVSCHLAITAFGLNGCSRAALLLFIDRVWFHVAVWLTLLFVFDHREHWTVTAGAGGKTFLTSYHNNNLGMTDGNGQYKLYCNNKNTGGWEQWWVVLLRCLGVLSAHVVPSLQGAAPRLKRHQEPIADFAGFSLYSPFPSVCALLPFCDLIWRGRVHGSCGRLWSLFRLKTQICSRSFCLHCLSSTPASPHELHVFRSAVLHTRVQAGQASNNACTVMTVRAGIRTRWW